MSQKVCVHCGKEVPQLYRLYGKHHIRLAICKQCNSVADPYVEVELTLLTIDIFLLKPEAYRHVLFNRTSIDLMLRDFWKFVVVSLTCDTYMKAAGLIENYKTTQLGALKIVDLFLIMLISTSVEFLSLVLFMLAIKHVYCKLNAINVSTSLLLVGITYSSYGKLVSMLMWVWDYHDAMFVHAVKAMVICSNTEVIKVLLGLSYPLCYTLVLAGHILAHICSEMIFNHYDFQNKLLTVFE